MFEPWVQTLSPLKFTQVQLQFSKFGVELNLEFNSKFEPEFGDKNSGFGTQNQSFQHRIRTPSQ